MFVFVIRWATAPILVLLLAFFSGSALAAEKEEYIVVYKNDVQLRSEVTSLRDDGVRVEDVYSHALKGALLRLTSSEAKELQSDANTLYVEKNSSLSLEQERPVEPWGIDRIDQRNLPLDGYLRSPGDGSGVKAYVIDTGIYSAHEEFAGRVLAGYGVIADGRGTEDCNGHGTHVSGTIAGVKYGVAPGAQLVPVRVLDCSGSGSVAGAIEGIDWVVQNHTSGQPAVANMSIGSTYSDVFNLAAERLVADGITTAIAAGNSSANACGYSPASAAGAITVGSSDVTDYRSYYSNWGPCLDIFAPGREIRSAWIGSPTSSMSISGTSMASPHVAGAAALLLGANPLLQPNVLWGQMLQNSSEDKIINSGDGSPNKLLFAGASASPPPPPPEEEPTTPVNDNFTNALELALAESPTLTKGFNTDATRETGEPLHMGSGKNSVWYQISNAPYSGYATILTEGSYFDTILSVYQGSSVSNLSLVAENDNYLTNDWSAVRFEVKKGQTYKIALSGYYPGFFKLSSQFYEYSPPVTPPEVKDSKLDLLNQYFTYKNGLAYPPLECYGGDRNCGATVRIRYKKSYRDSKISMEPWSSVSPGLLLPMNAKRALRKARAIAVRVYISSMKRSFRVIVER